MVIKKYITSILLLIAFTFTIGGELFSAFSVKEGDMQSLRRAIANATDEDLIKLAEQVQRGK